jgi:hypothetical protein
MKSEDSLAYLQQPATEPYLEPVESSPYPHTLLLDIPIGVPTNIFS